MYKLFKDVHAHKRFSIIPIFLNAEIVVQDDNWINFCHKLNNYINSVDSPKQYKKGRKEFDFGHISHVNVITGLNQFWRPNLDYMVGEEEAYILCKFWRLFDQSYHDERLQEFEKYITLKAAI